MNSCWEFSAGSEFLLTGGDSPGFVQKTSLATNSSLIRYYEINWMAAVNTASYQGPNSWVIAGRDGAYLLNVQHGVLQQTIESSQRVDAIICIPNTTYITSVFFSAENGILYNTNNFLVVNSKSGFNLLGKKLLSRNSNIILHGGLTPDLDSYDYTQLTLIKNVIITTQGSSTIINDIIEGIEPDSVAFSSDTGYIYIGYDTNSTLVHELAITSSPILSFNKIEASKLLVIPVDSTLKVIFWSPGIGLVDSIITEAEVYSVCVNSLDKVLAFKPKNRVFSVYSYNYQEYIACAIPNCAVCPNPRETCEECSTNFYLYANSCVTNCGTGLKPDPTNKFCINDSTPNCGPGEYKHQGNCVEKCPSDMVADEGICISSCPEGKLINNGVCVDECSPGFYQSGIECLSCPVGCVTCSNSKSCHNCDWKSEYQYEGKCLNYSALAPKTGINLDGNNKTLNCLSPECENCRYNYKECWDPKKPTQITETLTKTESVNKYLDPGIQVAAMAITSILGSISINFIANGFMKNELMILDLFEIDFGTKPSDIAQKLGGSYNIQDKSKDFVKSSKRISTKFTKRRVKVRGVSDRLTIVRIGILSFGWILRFFRFLFRRYFIYKQEINKFGIYFIYYTKLFHVNLFLLVYPYILFHCSRFHFYINKGTEEQKNHVYEGLVALCWFLVLFDLIYFIKQLLFNKYDRVFKVHEKNTNMIKQKKTKKEINTEKTLNFHKNHNEGIFSILISNLKPEAIQKSWLARYQLVVLYTYIGLYILMVMGANFKFYTGISLSIMTIIVLIDFLSYGSTVYNRYFSNWLVVFDRAHQIIFHLLFVGFSWVKYAIDSESPWLSTLYVWLYLFFIIGQNIFLLLNLGMTITLKVMQICFGKKIENGEIIIYARETSCFAKERMGLNDGTQLVRFSKIKLKLGNIQNPSNKKRFSLSELKMRVK